MHRKPSNFKHPNTETKCFILFLTFLLGLQSIKVLHNGIENISKGQVIHVSLSSTKFLPKRFLKTKKKATFNSSQGTVFKLHCPVCESKGEKKGGSEAHSSSLLPKWDASRRTPGCTTSHSKLSVKISHQEGMGSFPTHHGISLTIMKNHPKY